MGTSGSRWRLARHRQARKLAAEAPLRPAALEMLQFVVFSASRDSITDRMSLEPSLMSPGLSLGSAKWKNPGYTAVLTKA
jgi:hypothetical protein